MPVAVDGDVLGEFQNMTEQKKRLIFEQNVGLVVDALNLAQTLRDAINASSEARKNLSGLDLEREIKRIASEVICHCPLPAKISIPMLINGRTTIVDIAENLEALLVDLALQLITAQTRCRICSTPVRKRSKFCKEHGTRNARRERECRPLSDLKKINIYKNGG